MRELPPIKSILAKMKLEKDDILVIDGFVHLDDFYKKGLGGYLYDYLSGVNPIIGVAKKDFYSINKMRKEITRGKSKKPLFITSIGVDLNESCDYIKLMHGSYRLPTILKMVDQKSRNIL